jgi:hypothetical protein
VTFGWYAAVSQALRSLRTYEKEVGGVIAATYQDIRYALRTLARLRALPGVRVASRATDSPLSGGVDRSGVTVEGYQAQEEEQMGIDATYISPDYFKTLDLPVVAGRDFTTQDIIGSPKVAIINEKMARYFFGNGNPIGKRMGLGGVSDMTIVDVVKDGRYINLREPMVRHFYAPIMQQPP